MVRGVVVVIAVLVAVLVGVVASVFMRGGDGSDGDASPIVIGVPNWSSAMGTAYILREMIQNNTDAEVQLQPGTNEEIYAGIANGTIDIHPEGWEPNHDDWFEKYGDAMSRNSAGVYAFQGMCVDRQLAEQHNITHITDLLDPEIVPLFDTNGDGKGEVWVGAEGWGATTVERVRAKSYGYDEFFELLEMDEVAALQRLTETTAAGKLFAFYCYTPHSMWQTHDLYQLEEPLYDPAKWRVVFPSEDPDWLEKSNAAVGWKLAELHIYYANTLAESHPLVAEMLQGMYFTMEELLNITYNLDQGVQDPALYAQQWVMENR